MGRAFEFRKERKMKRWTTMSKVFTRLGKEIVMAVKAGGADPIHNARLRAIIQNAKSVNMPKENIERAIKKASEKNTVGYKTALFEGFAPYGIAILVETATDNNNRTVANLRSIFNKAGGNLGNAGAVEFMFKHVCNFKIKAKEIDDEAFELTFIDFGAENIFRDKESIIITAPFENFGIIQKELEQRNFEIITAGFDRIPSNKKKVTPEENKDVENLLEKIEADEDVQNVFHNMEE